MHLIYFNQVSKILDNEHILTYFMRNEKDQVTIDVVNPLNELYIDVCCDENQNHVKQRHISIFVLSNFKLTS